MGILFAAAYEETLSRKMRRLCGVILIAVLAGNVAYLWLKKEPQYRERALPTLALIRALNGADGSARHFPITICEFPLHPWIGEEAVAGFTSLSKDEVHFAASCEPAAQGTVLVWNEQAGQYRPGP
jgi:hypothetical protein